LKSDVERLIGERPADVKAKLDAANEKLSDNDTEIEEDLPQGGAPTSDEDPSKEV
jgi:hypothetical protein